MYHAKESGRNCLRIFQREMSEAPTALGASKPMAPEAASGVP
jgi:hypothetical protein